MQGYRGPDAVRERTIMNIGLFYWSPTAEPSHGSHVHGHHLIKYLTEFGHRVNVCWYHDPNSRCRLYRRRQLLYFLRDSDVLYFRLGNLGRQDLFSLLKLMPFLSRPLVWELNGLPETALFCGFSASFVNRAKFWHRLMAPLVDAAIVLTPNQADYLRSVGVRDVNVIHLGSDTTVLRPDLRSAEFRGRFDNRFLAAWIGKTSGGWHDLRCVLWAARLLERRRPDIAFLIVGDPSGLPQALPANVHHIGPFPYQQMGPILASCDCGMLFYRLDHGFGSRRFSPVKLYDYMASGLPILAQRGGPVAYQVRHGETGLLLDGTPDSLAAALETLADNPQRARRMGQAARRWAEDEFDWRQVIARKLAVIERVVQGRTESVAAASGPLASYDHRRWREQTSGAIVEPGGDHELPEPVDGDVDHPGCVVAPQAAGAR